MVFYQRLDMEKLFALFGYAFFSAASVFVSVSHGIPGFGCQVMIGWILLLALQTDWNNINSDIVQITSTEVIFNSYTIHNKSTFPLLGTETI